MAKGVDGLRKFLNATLKSKILVVWEEEEVQVQPLLYQMRSRVAFSSDSLNGN